MHFSERSASINVIAPAKAEFVASSKFILYGEKEEMYFASSIVYFYGVLCLVINLVT